MKYSRLILLPFSLIYGLILSLRNFFFDQQLLKSYTPSIPSIVVGNLSVGGTGKTPMIQLLCEWLQDYKVVVISRGYGRKSKGLFEVNTDSDAVQVGDEPLEIKQAFPNQQVWVYEDRVKATQMIEARFPETDIILYDDAFQHRKIKAHFNLLLSLSYRPFFKDFVMPTGTLREFRSGARRADYTVYTKLNSSIDTSAFSKNHSNYSASPFTFSHYDYTPLSLDKNKTYLLVTGIANTSSIRAYLEEYGINYQHLKYRDHQDFTLKDISEWEKLLKEFGHSSIICTVKDAVKINQLEHPFELEVLKIKHILKEETLLKETIYGLIHK